MVDTSTYISENELAELWRISTRPFNSRRAAGLLTSDKQEQPKLQPWPTHLYRTRRVERFHRRCATGFDGRPVPTLAQLQSGQDRLLTMSEVAEQFSITRYAISLHVRLGHFGALTFGPRIIRIPASEAARWLTQGADSWFVSGQHVSRVLGVRATILLQLTHDHRLEKVRVPGQGVQLFVTRKSLVAFVEDNELLSPFTNLQAWEHDLLVHNDILVPQHYFTLYCGINFRALQTMFGRGELLYIKTPGGKKMVPRRALLAHITANAIVPGIDAEAWLASCNARQAALVDEFGAVELVVGSDLQMIRSAVRSGELPGIWVPTTDGQRRARFLRTSVLNFSRRRERILGKADYRLGLDKFAH